MAPSLHASPSRAPRLPPGDREGLPRRRERDRPVEHAVERRKVDVRLVAVDRVLVDLIRDHEQVGVLARRGRGTLSAGLVWVVARREGALSGDGWGAGNEG
eukprot:6287837-Prymnesium_polylepis.1